MLLKFDGKKRFFSDYAGENSKLEIASFLNDSTKLQTPKSSTTGLKLYITFNVKTRDDLYFLWAQFILCLYWHTILFLFYAKVLRYM